MATKYVLELALPELTYLISSGFYFIRLENIVGCLLQCHAHQRLQLARYLQLVPRHFFSAPIYSTGPLRYTMKCLR